MKTHTEILNRMLAQQCASDNLPNGFRLFRFEMHCDGVMQIKAKLIDNATMEYEILDAEFIPYPYSEGDSA